MTYDFDWAGETLAIGDEEAETFVLPIEPSGNQAGANTPGPQAAYADLVNFGVYNGNFRLGPPDPSLNLDVASSTTGSNFMSGWRFVQSSNTNVTAKQVRDTSSPSGSNLRFTFASGGASSDQAFVEQVIDIGGSRKGWTGNIIRVAGFKVSGTGDVVLTAQGQYLTTDGAITGMPAEVSEAETYTTVGSVNPLKLDLAGTVVAGDARYLRLRLVAQRSGHTNAAVLDVADVRRDQGRPYVVLPDTIFPNSFVPAVIRQTNNLGIVDINGSQRVFSGQLVGIPYSLLDIPAGATTDLQITDNALGIGQPRMGVPWGGSIVGMSYRMSAAVGAGTLRFNVTAAGVAVWTAFPAAALANNGSATQAPGTDTFTTNTGLGIEAVGSAALTVGLDVAAMLWVLVDYDGT